MGEEVEPDVLCAALSHVLVMDVVNFLMCWCSRLGDNLEQCLPGLRELVLTNNNIQELVSAPSPTPLWERATTKFQGLKMTNLPVSFCVVSLPPLYCPLQGDLDPLASVKTLTLLRYVQSSPAICALLLACLTLRHFTAC